MEHNRFKYLRNLYIGLAVLEFLVLAILFVTKGQLIEGNWFEEVTKWLLMYVFIYIVLGVVCYAPFRLWEAKVNEKKNPGNKDTK